MVTGWKSTQPRSKKVKDKTINKSFEGSNKKYFYSGRDEKMKKIDELHRQYALMHT